MLSHNTSQSNESSFSETCTPSQPQPMKRPLLNFERFAELSDFEASDADNVDMLRPHELLESEALEDKVEVQKVNAKDEDDSVSSFVEEWTNDQDELLYQQSNNVHKEPTHMIEDNALEDNDAIDKLSHISSIEESGISGGHYEMVQENEEEVIQRSTADDTARWNPSNTGGGPSIPTLHTHSQGIEKRVLEKKNGNILTRGKTEGRNVSIASTFDHWLQQRQMKDAKWRELPRDTGREYSQPWIPGEKQCPQEPPTEVDQDDNTDGVSLGGNSDAVQSLLRHFEEHDLEIHQEADEEIMLNKLRSRFKFQPEVDFEHGIKCIAKRICSIKPFMHWRTLRALDLSYQHLTTLIDLEDIVPNLEDIDV